jgi:hypothetical protein
VQFAPAGGLSAGEGRHGSMKPTRVRSMGQLNAATQRRWWLWGCWGRPPGAVTTRR